MTAYNLSFGAALEAIKQDKSVAREEWGESRIFLNRGNSETIHPRGTEDKWTISGVDERLFELGCIGSALRFPNINQGTGTSTITGWTPSQVDMLAEDWGILE